MLFSVPKSLAFLLAMCSMVGPLSANTYMPGLGMIAEEYGVGEVAAYQTLSSYLICFALSSLFVGAISDSLGRRSVMMGGLLSYALSCMICAFSPNYESFLVGRILMGLFASTGTVLAMAVTRDLFSGRQAQELTSLIAVIFALAPAFAPIIGGWLVVLFGWRSVFFFLAGFAFLMALATFFLLKETHPEDKRTAFHFVPLVTTYAHSFKNVAFTAGVFCNGFVFMGSILFSAGAPDYVENVMGMGVTDFGYLMLPLIGFSVMLFFAYAGEAFLKLLGISIPAFRIAGGIMLFIVALQMIFVEEQKEKAAEEATDHPYENDVSVFPLAVPLIAGPGSIASIILLMSERHGNWREQLYVIVSLIAVSLITYTLFCLSNQFARLFGQTINTVVSKLLGIILGAMAAQFIIDGVNGLI